MAEHNEADDDSIDTLPLPNAVESIVDDVFVRTRSALGYFADDGVDELDAWEMAGFYRDQADEIEQKILESHEDDEVVQEAIRTLQGVHGVDVHIRGKVARYLSDVQTPYTREDVQTAFRYGGVPREEQFLYEEVCAMCDIEE